MASKELQKILEMFESRPKRESLTVAGLRAESEAAAKMFPAPVDTIVENIDSGGVKGEWISVPGTDKNRVFMFLHSGGYIMGSPKGRRERVARISRASGARGFVVAYRLAPEHPFPAAVEDCFKGYRWLLESGISAKQIVLCGESAGGGLVMATLAKAKSAGLPMPLSSVCISPWVDLTNSGASMKTKASVDPMLTKEICDWMADVYLNNEDRRNPLASPIYGDMHGFPPMLIQVGTSEVLLDDSIRLAESAKTCGVSVQLETWDEMIHVWHAFASILPEAREAIEHMGQFMKKSYDG